MRSLTCEHTLLSSNEEFLLRVLSAVSTLFIEFEYRENDREREHKELRDCLVSKTNATTVRQIVWIEFYPRREESWQGKLFE